MRRFAVISDDLAAAVPRPRRAGGPEIAGKKIRFFFANLASLV